METVNDRRQRLEALRRQARAQVETLVALGKAFAAEAENVRRQDYAQSLRALRSSVSAEVEEAQRMESAASYAFTRAKLMGGVAGLAAGLLVAALRNKGERPFRTGMRLARGQLQREEPFGTVLVMARSDDPLDEAKVVSLSEMARESDMGEANVRATLEADGYLLLTHEAFCHSVKDLEDRVLQGMEIIPATAACLDPARRQKWVARARKPPASVVWRKVDEGLPGTH